MRSRANPAVTVSRACPTRPPGPLATALTSPSQSASASNAANRSRAWRCTAILCVVTSAPRMQSLSAIHRTASRTAVGPDIDRKVQPVQAGRRQAHHFGPKREDSMNPGPAGRHAHEDHDRVARTKIRQWVIPGRHDRGLPQMGVPVTGRSISAGRQEERAGPLGPAPSSGHRVTVEFCVRCYASALLRSSRVALTQASVRMVNATAPMITAPTSESQRDPFGDDLGRLTGPQEMRRAHCPCSASA